MWNPFKRFGKKKQVFKELKDIAFVISVFDKFEREGLITWRQKDKILIIEEALAVMKLAEGKKGFQNFLNQAALWQNERIISEAYETRRIKIETDTVRKAQKDYANLTKADIHRIRQDARENMTMIPPEQLDCIKEFDIFIIRANAPSVNQATEANGQLLAVGHYDGEKVEMAMYDDIKHNLKNEE